MYHLHDMGGWGGAALMMVLWTAILVGSLALLAWVIAQWPRRGPEDGRPAGAQARTARELLDERLARGEIDVDEYQRRRAAMS
jgi:putative membrane protein